MPATAAPRRPFAASSLLAALVVVSAMLAAVVPSGTAHAADVRAMDSAVTRKLDTSRLETTSTAARCLESQVATMLRAKQKPTSTSLRRACRLKSVSLATVSGRGSASRVVKKVLAEPALVAALRSAGHLSVTVRGSRPAARRVVVAVGASVPPRVNDAPEADFWADEAYGLRDEDPVVVTLNDDSRDDDGSVVAWSWSVTAPDGSPVAVQQNAGGGTFTALVTGPHTVTLTVTDNEGGTDTATETVDPLDPLTADQKAALEQSILDNTNTQRALYGLEPASQAPLAWHSCLGANARAHALNMAIAGYLYHQEPNATLTACPEYYPYWAENVLWRTNQFDGPTLVKQWMDSPPHRESILSPYTHMGVGVHYDRSKGRLYAVQVFYRIHTP